MKTKIILILSFVFAIQSQAQIQTKVFTLNLGEPSRKALLASDSSNTRLIIKSKEPLAFKLINGNPYKYKYVINHKLVNFFEGQDYKMFDSITNVIKQQRLSDNNKNENVDLGKKIKNEIDSLNVEINSISEKLKRKNLSNKDRKDLLSEQLSFKSKISLLEVKFDEIRNQSVAQYISKSIYSSNFIETTKLNNILKTIKPISAKNTDDDKKNIQNASLLLKQSFEDLKIDIDKYVLEISAEDFLNQKEFKTKRDDLNKRFILALQNIEGISVEANNFSDLLSDFNNKVEEINSISKKIKEEISKMYQLKLYNYLLPVDINGKNIDVVEVTVERYDKTATNPTPDKYTYNIWVRGGVKIDISGGLFLSSLMDKEYETKDDGSNKFIFEKNRGDYEFGFGSTINVSLRGGSWVRPGLSIGALFTTNQKFQLLTGLGFIIGKEERIVLHTGLSMGRISRISDNYKTDGSVSYDLGTEGTIPMTEKFAFGHFFGLTYNFGKVKKQDEKN